MPRFQFTGGRSEILRGNGNHESRRQYWPKRNELTGRHPKSHSDRAHNYCIVRTKQLSSVFRSLVYPAEYQFYIGQRLKNELNKRSNSSYMLCNEDTSSLFSDQGSRGKSVKSQREYRLNQSRFTLRRQINAERPRTFRTLLLQMGPLVAETPCYYPRTLKVFYGRSWVAEEKTHQMRT